ncbi:hypothetical protein [Sodalis sp. C49]|uniref:hypothetical protein n=1 Tax=Sodalis sp. C49 TaxID=3228929 RepID=UPI003965B92C
MPNMTNAIDINSHGNMRCIDQKLMTHSSRHPYTEAVMNVKNIYLEDKINKTEINGHSTARDGDAQVEKNHEKNIDYLFCCVNELRNNLDCLLRPGNTKYIAIELMGNKKSIPAKNISLPSGRSIYAGYVEERLIVSDGSNYHIEHSWHTPLTWKATFANLLAHLTYASGWSNAKDRPGWMHKAFNWLGSMGDPLIFPQADGKPLVPTNFTSGNVIYAAQADFSAQLGPADTISREEKDIETTTLSPPVKQALSSSSGTDKAVKTAVIPSQLIFIIDSHEFKIAPANLEAEAQLQSLIHYFFQQNAAQVDNPLTMLLEFDAYIGREMAIMFHQGLYLKEKNNSLNIIIFKMISENIISTMNILALKGSPTADDIAKYSEDQIRIGDYITDLEQRVLDATRRVDTKIIKELVSHIRNKDFPTAKKEIIDNIKQSTFEMRVYYKRLLHYFILFTQALDEYRHQMTLDDFPSLEKALYINSQDIYSALISGNSEHLTNSLIKLKFLYIFEYTRSNGISIFTSNFIVPGEISNLWHIFVEDEIEFDKEGMNKLFAEELISFIYQHKTSHLHFDQALDLIEISRLDEINTNDKGNWMENNISYFYRAQEILSNIIEANQFEKEKFLENIFWYNDFVSRLHNDKTLFIMMTYLINLQKLFINEVVNFRSNKRHIVATTQEQRIAAAKIEAARNISLKETQEKDDYSLILEYNNLESNGHLEVLTKAAVAWYMSQQNNIDDGFLSAINVLYILKHFISAQQKISHEHHIRQQQPFTSVFQLKPSSQIDSADGYYNQFRYYKIHDSFSEAQKLTMIALNNSTLNYLDVIYPPKDIICFKIFSRNYVTNHLSPFTTVYLPAENLGYLSIATLHSNRQVLLSTLNGFPFIADIDTPEKTDIILQMKSYWANCDSIFSLRNRPQFPINETTLASLFPKIDANSNRLTSMVEILLRPPEEESIDIAAPAYGLVAVKDNDINLIITPYTPQQQNTFQPLSINHSLLTNFDYMNQATLISIADELKEKLYEATWLEYIAAFIPFFTTLCRHWHDEEHEIKFEDVIFDIYDLMLTLASFTGQFKKISENTLKHALHKAIEQKIRHDLFKKFVINELINASPEIGVKFTKTALNEFFSYFNVIHPSGKALSVFVDNMQVNILDSIAIANRALKSDSAFKKKLRQPWRANVSDKILETLNTGVATTNSTSAELFYVINNNDYFPVFWDKYNGEWRIINSHGPNYKNFAIPVARTHSGNWVASAGQLVDLKFSSFSISPMNHKKFDNKIIFMEPIKTSSYQNISDNYLIDFHKKILHFYLQRHYYSQRIIGAEIDINVFLDHSFHFFSIKQEILALQEFNGFTYDIKSSELVIKTLSGIDDSKVQFRAVCGWRSKNDMMAETYFALAIKIGEMKYILDLNEIRSIFGFNDTRDVFTENEWVMMMNNSPSPFELIKFKDFEFIGDAKYFNYREATAPHTYIKNGFLLKEPSWYRSLTIKTNTSLKNLNVFQETIVNPEIHLVARVLRNHFESYNFNEEFILYVLLKSAIIDNAGAARLLNLITQAKSNRVMSLAILSNQQIIPSTSALLKINKGKLIAVFNYLDQLEHLLLCLGNGRFIGLGNDFFGFAPQARATLIIAEQMGTFIHGLLKPHHVEQTFTVFAGDAFGAKDDAPVMLDDVPREKIPEYFIDGRIKKYREQHIPREQVLLGKDCHISRINGATPRLSIKLRGTPFMVNHMDVVEFSDILKGLKYLDGEKFDLRSITSIELTSCFSGYGSRYSTAQALANELGIRVYTVPPYISDTVRLRRPEWFYDYYPEEVSMSTMGTPSELPHWTHHQEYIKVQNMQRAMHEILYAVRDVIRRLEFIQRGQNITDSPFHGVSQHVPFIYIDILQLFYPPNPHHPLIVGDIILRPDSLKLLKEIIADYTIVAGNEVFIIEQAFMDIILSIDEYKYLSNQFNTTSLQD